MISPLPCGPARRPGFQGRPGFGDYPARVTVSSRRPSAPVRLLFLGMADWTASLLSLCGVYKTAQIGDPAAKGHRLFICISSLLGTQHLRVHRTWKHVAVWIKSPNSTQKVPNMPRREGARGDVMGQDATCPQPDLMTQPHGRQRTA